MDKARLSLANLEYGLFPKASDHEETAEIGWLFYSVRQQDEERLSEMISCLVNENVGVEWRPIRCNDRNRKAVEDPSTRIYAVHLETLSARAADIRQKLSTWFSSNSKMFPDGTKMRLVPLFQTILSYSHKTKYAVLVARQAAISARICSRSTWELAANLTIDRMDPASGKFLQQILLSIPSQVFQSTPLFHTIDRTWRSTNGITFTFHPENKADARLYITGLIPFLKDSHNNQWFLKQFSEEARLRNATSKCDHVTQQAYTAEEVELDNFSEDDEELNLTDVLSGDRPSKTLDIEIKMQKEVELEDWRAMYNDIDSISTFHPATPSQSSSTPLALFSPKTIPYASTTGDDNLDLASKMMDSESRISSLEYKFNSFQDGSKEIKRQAEKDAQKMLRLLQKFYHSYKPENLARHTRLTMNILFWLISRLTT